MLLFEKYAGFLSGTFGVPPELDNFLFLYDPYSHHKKQKCRTCAEKYFLCNVTIKIKRLRIPQAINSYFTAGIDSGNHLLLKHNIIIAVSICTRTSLLKVKVISQIFCDDGFVTVDWIKDHKSMAVNLQELTY